MNVVQHVANAKTSTSTAIGTGALISPWWLDTIETVGGAAMMIGGLVLLYLTIALKIREYRNKPKAD